MNQLLQKRMVTCIRLIAIGAFTVGLCGAPISTVFAADGWFTTWAGPAQDPGTSGSTFPPDTTIREAVWGMLPHTHLRGTRWEYKLVKADSTSQVVLSVPHYHFNWQTYYMFATPLEIPTGGKITATAWYDNSATNKSNPDATKDVKWGDQTWEEMQYTGFLYTVPSRRLK